MRARIALGVFAGAALLFAVWSMATGPGRSTSEVEVRVPSTIVDVADVPVTPATAGPAVIVGSADGGGVGGGGAGADDGGE